MIRNLTRTCDMCHKAIPSGEFVPRSADRDGLEVLMILAENQDRDLKLLEMPDGTISLDTCRDCFCRMPFSHSSAVN